MTRCAICGNPDAVHRVAHLGRICDGCLPRARPGYQAPKPNAIGAFLDKGRLAFLRGERAPEPKGRIIRP